MRFMENLVLVFIYIGIGLLLYGGTLVHSAGSFPCDPSTGLSSFPFCDTSLTIADRAKDLVGRLTLQEKVQQLVSGASAITRLGIPKYEWWSEALHGVSNVGSGTQFGAAVPGATSFPQVILTAASFNASLWEAIGRVASTEARGMYNAGVAGLTYWSPNVNLFSDPRWGRGQETPGEDPTVVGKYATSYVRGLQGTDGSDPNRLKVAACCKHYTAYEVDNWKRIQRFTFNAIVTSQDLEDSYNPPFKSCVLDGNVASVMCSYNQVNGVPTCADKNLLAGTFRGQWNLNGYIVSDCDSVSVFYNQQHYAATPEDAAADAINAGLDLDCGSFLGQYTGSAVNESKVNESAVDQALFNTFTVLMRLGRFDGDPAKQPYGNLGPNDVCTDEHQQLALEAAKQGIVLLKNDGALPLLTNNVHSLAVIGPNANVTKTMIGNYAGIPCKYTTPLEGLSLYTQTVYAPGCANVACNGNDSLLAGAVQTASNADATVLIIGGDQSLEAEALDRTSLLLPGQQQQLVSQVTAASKGSVVLVIMSGGPFDITFAKDDAKISGILWVGYPGQAGGAAIADVIFGAYNPGGKLPVTWYPEDFAVNVPMTNMNMRPDNATGYPGRTYRFYIGKTVYAFGYGLSYTTFSHSLVHAPEHISLPLDACSQMKSNSCEFLSVTHTNCEDLSMEIHVDVKNVGPRDGGHVLFLFSTPPSNDIDAPQKQLISFRKVHVQAGALKRVQFTLAVCKDLSVVDKSGTRMLPVGSHLLHIGDLQHSVSLQISSCDSHKGNMVLSFRKLIRTDKMAQTWTLCIQVSCYPNSGQGNFEYVLKDNALNKVVQKRREIHGVTTNNEAYYLALIEGLKTAKIYGANNVSVFTNSELLCNQMKGAYQVRKSNLKPLHREARAIVSQFHFFTISHHSDIKRMSNGLLCGKISSLGEGVKTEMASTYVPSKIIDGRCYTSLLCVCFFLIIVLVSLMVWDFL